MNPQQAYQASVSAMATLLGTQEQALRTKIDQISTSSTRNTLGAEAFMRQGRTAHSLALQTAYHTFFGTPAAAYADTRTWCDSKSEAEAKTLLKRIYEHSKEPTAAGPGQCSFAPSYIHANSLVRNDSRKAIERASWLMGQAWPSMVNLNANQALARYERWFGTKNAVGGQARFDTVKANMKRIHDALCSKPIMLYYRGKGVSGPVDCHFDGSMLASADFFGAAYRNGAPPPFNPNFTHIFLGQAFIQATSIYGNDAMAGVIIHELSHAIVGTEDNEHPVSGETCYGPVLCKDIATNYPHLAVNNADNYEYYCEEFQAHGWKPRDRPPPAPVRIPARFQPVRNA